MITNEETLLTIIRNDPDAFTKALGIIDRLLREQEAESQALASRQKAV
jgi:hypothetical protein